MTAKEVLQYVVTGRVLRAAALALVALGAPAQGKSAPRPPTQPGRVNTGTAAPSQAPSVATDPRPVSVTQGPGI
jgi:hypothetical protein